MDAPNPSSLRVLIRPSSATTTSSAFTSTTTLPSSTNSPDLPLSSSLSLSTNSASSSYSSSSLSSSSTSVSQSRSSDGVVVVGFIGRREEDLTQLTNRILDYNVFGSGTLDKNFPTCDRREKEVTEAVKDWFHSRRISYYYEEEKGIVFLQFVSTRCPIMEDSSESVSGLDSILEQLEYGDLQGMLLMFSVCHVIIFLQEGSRFDTQILKKFRILQAAKHALVPYMKSHIKPTLNSRVSSSSSSPSQTTVSLKSSKNPSPGRGGGSIGRHSSSISLMSGLGSYSSLFPGQCTPVILFVFLDDFPESPNPGSHVDDSGETSSLNQSLSLSGLPRPSLPVKGSSSVVMLSRPMSKSEGGFRKKLQSSLEAQIRFLIKKCRTLAGSEGNHTGSRGGGNASSAPLFSLEASRAVALLDRFTNQRGESLDFATGLVEEVLNAKVSSDTLLLESHYQGANKEDIQSIKEFIYRQSDTLRGRGGLVPNTNSGSASGVGMVAVAAAAAAASAASGKPLTTPELPSLDNWLSSSQLILEALLSVRRGVLDESEITHISKRKPVRRNAASTQVERIPHGGIDPLQSAISWLESGKGLNMKFSTSWCQRALPAAKELYLKDLPDCYPTSLHEAQLDKALRAFQSMVKGPAVHVFTKKLEDECTSIWRSGRQLCDAVSLTGKPCMHQRHNIEVDGALLGAEIKPHSSGFVFLHACACGRSRRLRDDPFDLETANITFNCFPNCHNLLPALQLPEVSNAGPIKPASWSLIRVGGARYYESAKGLLQSGFCSTEKLLLKWTILLEKLTKASNAAGVQERFVQEPKVVSVADEEIKEVGAPQSFPGEAHTGVVETQRKRLENISSLDKKISFGRGLPHFNMRRPFSEVVAGSVATDAAFPPLQQRKQPTAGSEKSVKQRVARSRGEENVQVNGEYQGSQKSEDVSSARESSHGVGGNGYTDGEPFLQIGSNVVPVSMNAGGKTKSNTGLKHVIVYFGFEHECPHGHRFLLTSEHLNELGSLYSLHEESHIHSSMKSLDRKAESLNFTKNSAHEKAHPHVSTSGNKARTSSRSNQTMANGSQHVDRLVPFSESGKEHNRSSTELTLSKSIEGLEERLEYATLDDGGHSFSLLNRNLPIYMNCPHCRISKSKKGHQQIKFASTVSQLQRIFLVTPPFPIVLATCPVVQFEASCLPPSIPDHERQSQFSIGCRVILPPDSFLILRLPFVYGVQLEDRSLHPLHHLEHQPELTAWISGGTILQIMSKGSSSDEEVQM
ncbi:Smg8/Smg9 [Macleaya cordata]|uniref:Nonsense-mediated mRNA decay factor SMG8 n=1 Tax=Macleaya cordata TaxID=56857 RepID=A0A200R5I2_MACCD|nr:Smg8/Smg9 [Macleaya cordata]